MVEATNSQASQAKSIALVGLAGALIAGIAYPLSGKGVVALTAGLATAIAARQLQLYGELQQVVRVSRFEGLKREKIRLEGKTAEQETEASRLQGVLRDKEQERTRKREEADRLRPKVNLINEGIRTAERSVADAGKMFQREKCNKSRLQAEVDALRNWTGNDVGLFSGTAIEAAHTGCAEAERKLADLMSRLEKKKEEKEHLIQSLESESPKKTVKELERENEALRKKIAVPAAACHKLALELMSAKGNLARTRREGGREHLRLEREIALTEKKASIPEVEVDFYGKQIKYGTPEFVALGAHLSPSIQTWIDEHNSELGNARVKYQYVVAVLRRVESGEEVPEIIGSSGASVCATRFGCQLGHTYLWVKGSNETMKGGCKVQHPGIRIKGSPTDLKTIVERVLVGIKKDVSDKSFSLHFFNTIKEWVQLEKAPRQLLFPKPYWITATISSDDSIRKSIQGIADRFDSDLWHATDLTWFEMISALKQGAIGLAWLHSEGYIHGDVKSRNICQRKDGKEGGLIDFDTLRNTESWCSAPVGTMRCLPPDYLADSKAGNRTALDGYGFGMTLYQVLMGRAPSDVDWETFDPEFAAVSSGLDTGADGVPRYVREAVVHKDGKWTLDLDLLREGAANLVLPRCGPPGTEEICDLIRRCLNPIPDSRPNMPEVVSILEGVLSSR